MACIPSTGGPGRRIVVPRFGVPRLTPDIAGRRIKNTDH